MVISDEIKFPRPLHVDPFPSEEEVVRPAEGVAAIRRIGEFKKEWSQSRQRAGKEAKREKFVLLPNERKQVRELVDNVNNHLDNQGIQIHLVLVRDEEGYTLDVYDCTDNQVCRVIRDFVVNFEDIPLLASSLENETGLLVDTVL